MDPIKNEEKNGSLDSLSMLDNFGQRIFIIPAEVRGYYQKRRTLFQGLLLILFLLLPWISIGGHQSILLDIPGRRFTFFGLELFAYDVPLLFLVLVIFVGSLFLLTALWGRVWCGWACPQTVFIERVYRTIERFAEGNYIQRRQLAVSDMSFEKVARLLLKWSLYLVVSSVFAHSFIAYFAGGAHLLKMMQKAPSENSSYFIWVSSVTALNLFNFGWFREQFCLIVCPYGRFQSVLQDTQTISIFYDSQRGEPRRRPGVAASIPTGDCVSCHRCVEVCPTGIDIRNGTQMECIGCTACIDACDEIMTKVHKPKGLISYRPEVTRSENKGRVQLLRPRTVMYLGVVGTAGIVLAFLLSTHNLVFIEVLRAKGLPYEMQNPPNAQSIVQNQFKIRVENHKAQTVRLGIRANEPDIFVKLIIPGGDIELPAGARMEIPVIAQVANSQFRGHSGIEMTLQVNDLVSHQVLKESKVTLLGPSMEQGL